MLDFIAIPFGKFLYFIYDTLAFKNYGLAIILFTVIVKSLLLPLTVKQMKSVSKQQELQPLVMELNKKYKNDKQKLQQETMKMYQENGFNPLGGCLPLLVQLPILFSLYRVVISPLQYMFGMGKEQISNIVTTINDHLPNITDIVKVSNNKISGYYEQLISMDVLNRVTEKVGDIHQAIPGLSQHIKQTEVIDLNFIGLNLGKVATYDISKISADAATYLPLLLLTIIAVGTTFISTKMSMAKSIAANKDKNLPGSSMQTSMLYIGPIMTLMFSFSLPAAMVLYWTAGYVFQIFQQLYINKIVMKKKEVATK